MRKGVEETMAGMLSRKARPSTNSYKDDVLLMNASAKNNSEMMEGSSHQLRNRKEPTRRQQTRYESQQT